MSAMSSSSSVDVCAAGDGDLDRRLGILCEDLATERQRKGTHQRKPLLSIPRRP